MTADPTQASAPNSDANDSAHAPLRLRRVQIRNYKSIAFCDVSLAPLTILVGRNGAGKSNFLDALSFLRDVLSDGLGKALQTRGGWDSIHHRGATNGEISIEIELAFRVPGPPRPQQRIGGIAILDSRYWRIASGDAGIANFIYSGAFGLKDGKWPEVTRESCSIRWESDAELVVVNKDSFFSCELREFNSSPAGQELDSRLSWTVSRDRLSLLAQLPLPPILALSEELSRMKFYDLHPDSMRLPQRRSVGALLERNGANVASVIETTRPHDPYAVQRIERYVSAVVPEVIGVSVRPLAEHETMAFKIQTKEGETPREFISASMSDGTLRTLAAVTAVFQSTSEGAPSLVAIEEPETSLHPGAQRALAAAFDEATLRTQVILTTHSPELLDCAVIQPENIRVVEFVDGATSITTLDEASVSIVRDELSTLGGLERDRQLELNEDDLRRQADLARREPSRI